MKTKHTFGIAAILALAGIPTAPAEEIGLAASGFTRFVGEDSTVYELRHGFPEDPQPLELWTIDNSEKEGRLVARIWPEHVPIHSAYELASVVVKDEEIGILFRTDTNQSEFKPVGNTWGRAYSYTHILLSSTPEKTLAAKGYKAAPFLRKIGLPLTAVGFMPIGESLWVPPDDGSEPPFGYTQKVLRQLDPFRDGKGMPWSVSLESPRQVVLRVREDGKERMDVYENDIDSLLKNGKHLDSRSPSIGLRSQPLVYYKTEDVHNLADRIRKANWQRDIDLARYLERVLRSMASWTKDDGMSYFEEYIRTTITDDVEVAEVMRGIGEAMDFLKQDREKSMEEGRKKTEEMLKRLNEHAIESKRRREEQDAALRERWRKRAEERQRYLEQRRLQKEAEAAE